jgi:hypothetical protein
VPTGGSPWKDESTISAADKIHVICIIGVICDEKIVKQYEDARYPIPLPNHDQIILPC